MPLACLLALPMERWSDLNSDWTWECLSATLMARSLDWPSEPMSASLWALQLGRSRERTSALMSACSSEPGMVRLSDSK